MEPREAFATVESGKNSVRLRLDGSGEIGLAAEVHAAALSAAGAGRDVLIDWRRAEHLDAATLQILLALRAEMAQGSRRITASAPHADSRRVLEVAGVASLFPRPSSVNVRGRSGTSRRNAQEGDACPEPF